MPAKIVRRLTGAILCCCLCFTAQAQRFLADYDSTLFIKDTVRPLIKRFENLHFSGYIQPQFQVAQQKGAVSFEGGNFSDSASNRFLLRRARIRLDYLVPAKGKNFPLAFFAFQFDITERGAFARDVFLRLFEAKGQKLSMTMGLFARPFGYELNLASSVRESPERGRMSQLLMPAERDIGAMVSYESRKNEKGKPLFKLDAGVFNGPGLSATTDFDSYKDFISRAILKPYAVSKKITVSAGASLLYGGWLQATRYKYETKLVAGKKQFVADSSLANLGVQAPRHYYGADVQLVFKQKRGKTELRAEYWRGRQPGTAATTANPATLPMAPTYIRNFDGAFFYFIQNIVNEEWEVVAKYDWYDPNTAVRESEIGASGFTAADIKFSTIGFGLTHYFAGNLKAVAYYNIVRNRPTALAGYTTDSRDDNFTFRIQLRF